MKYKYYIIATFLSLTTFITIIEVYRTYTDTYVLLISIMFLIIANWFFWILANSVTIDDELKKGECMIVNDGDGSELYTELNVEFTNDYINIHFENGYVTLPNELIEDIYNEIQKGGD